MRHARAAPSDYRTRDDTRWLTDSGRQMAREAGRALVEQGQQIDTIVTSPLVRAVQTAEIVARAMDWTGEIVALESLRSESPAQSATEDLQALGSPAVLAVSHEPIVSTISALLLDSGKSDLRAGYRTAEIRGIAGATLRWRWQG